MDNTISQSQVAYEDGPKEINAKRRMGGDKQFGKANVMEQENKGYKQKDYPVNPTLKRYGEHR